MANHLVHAISPYLLQHAENPVDWYPWGPEALSKARAENKIIFLSIGYAACHWCHVMAHESFEDPETAQTLNRGFVCIKVDREERPDLDSIYMQATTAMTGSGGWPMSVFLTPDLKPFFAGTYFPSRRMHGLPSFSEVLLSVSRAWADRPDEAERGAAQVMQSLRSVGGASAVARFNDAALEGAAATLVKAEDAEHGGWGAAPKFPQARVIEFLLRRATAPVADTESLEVALHTLKAMARGGMYDIVGGGFSRYSTDRQWRVPHFEKMLYDNAQLALAYLHAWLITTEPFYKRIAEETLDFVIREMTDSEGGFYSSLDADSEGTEGKFYVWTSPEIRAALPDDSLFELFSVALGVGSANWAAQGDVLQRALDDASLAARFHVQPVDISRRLPEALLRLRTARAAKVRPTTDDKVITSWNALMLQAFAQASRYIDDEQSRTKYHLVATRNAAFLLEALRPDGSLRHTWRRGVVGHEVFLEDYAGLILGLLEIYQTDFHEEWFATARALCDEMIHRFSDPGGGFFDCPDDAESLILRPKDLQDNALPCGNSMACEALLKLAALTGNNEYSALAQQSLDLVAEEAGHFPIAFAHWLNAADFALSGGQQLALVYRSLADAAPFLDIVNCKYRPNLVVAGSEVPASSIAPAVLANRPLVDGRATAYVCRNFVCRLPTTEPAELRLLL